MDLVLQQVSKPKGTPRFTYLAPDAAVALASIEKDTDGLIYTDLWRDSVSTLLNRRLKKGSPLVGYSAHNYGLAVDLDVEAILKQKMIRYEDLIWLMQRRGWYCFRRDGVEDLPGSEHFNFLGENNGKYLDKCTMDPATWHTTAELRIWERHGQDFKMETMEVQDKLKKIGLLHGPISGQRDLYLREAIMAFQRAWDLTQTGSPDMTLCRVLAFVTADVKNFMNTEISSSQ